MYVLCLDSRHRIRHTLSYDDDDDDGGGDDGDDDHAESRVSSAPVSNSSM